jgi:hypothetical protein
MSALSTRGHGAIIINDKSFMKNKNWEDKLNELGFNHPPLHQFIKNLIKSEVETERERIKKEGFNELTRNPDWDTPQQESLIKIVRGGV